MSVLFRSSKMTYVRLLISETSSYIIMSELGKSNIIHLNDLTSIELSKHDSSTIHSHHYKSINERQNNLKKRLQQCTLIQKRLESFQLIFDQFNIKTPLLADYDEKMDIAIENHKGDIVEELSSIISNFESTITKNILFYRSIQQTIEQLREQKAVIEFCVRSSVFENEELSDENDLSQYNRFNRQSLNYGSVGITDSLSRRHSSISTDRKSLQRQTSITIPDITRTSISGVIPISKSATFKRMVWRISRGNAIVQFGATIQSEPQSVDPLTNETMGKVEKVVFTVISVSAVIHAKITRLANALGGSLYEVSSFAHSFHHQLTAIDSQMSDNLSVFLQTQSEIQQQLNSFVGPDVYHSDYIRCLVLTRREAAIIEALRRCVYTRSDQKSALSSSTLLLCEGWICMKSIDQLHSSLNRVYFSDPTVQQAIVQILSPESTTQLSMFSTIDEVIPPTHFETNKFTSSFQSIVNTYGIPHYREVNPGIFTIISFPFLFGLMYGDIGHGSFLFVASLFMVLNERKFLLQEKRGQMNEIFAMCFSGRYLLLMMGAFGLYAGLIYNDCLSLGIPFFSSQWSFGSKHKSVNGRPNGTVYPFGLDHNWHGTTNELAFYNSFKMKLSVIIGITQMVFGIILAALNHIAFKEIDHFFLEFIPRLLLMLCTFGYMIFLIILKWCLDWSLSPPPALVQTMIAMFLSPGQVPPDQQLYSFQPLVQLLLLLIAVGSVPVMLLGVPLRERSKRRNQYRPILETVNDYEEYSFSDHLITQAIHTIEFVLGCVSNTASYLRLWALSLAHAQLSSVFWTRMVQQYGLQSGSPIALVVAFAVFCGATAGVLLAMDVLECFLHALRLHWVEFNNKFYRGDGIEFQPFSLNLLTKEQTMY